MVKICDKQHKGGEDDNIETTFMVGTMHVQW